MDIETQTPVQEQLPQIRRIAGLDDIPRVIPPKEALPTPQKIKPTPEKRYLIRFFMIGFLFLGILGFETSIIYRYDKLNKRLYQISSSLKTRITSLQNKLQYTKKLNNKVITSRKGLVKNYLELGSQHRILQYKMDNYKGISIAKSSRINILEGDLRVAYARVEAVGVQNEVLATKLREREGYIRELTSKLINSIGEQEILVNENLRLKEDIDRLSKELVGLKESIQAKPLEDKDANK